MSFRTKPFFHRLIPLPPPLGVVPGSFFLGGHAPADILQSPRKQHLPKPHPKLGPEGGPLRHEERPCPEAEEHHGNRDAVLPAYDQATFLLGIAQTKTGAMSQMLAAILAGNA